jgi:membrane protein DedA with SNARE-associated domain
MATLLDFVNNYGGFTPYFMLFGILLACGLVVPIPEDITLFVGGMLSYYGQVNVWATIAVCFVGVLTGDSFIFFLGAKYGKMLTRKAFFRSFLTEEHLDQVQIKLHAHGNKMIFAARFMPGLRAPFFFSAGTLHLPFSVFLFYDGLAALISVPTIVWLVYHFGSLADQVIDMIKHVEHGIIAVIVAVILFFVVKHYSNSKE